MTRTSLALLALLLGAATTAAAQQRTTSPHGSLTTPCATCHRADSWTSIEVSSAFDHSAFGFPLTGAHGATTCRGCHANLDFSQARGDCTSCHTDFHRGELGPNCARCHTNRSFGDRDVMAQGHQLTRFPLTGGHLAVDCSQCHTAGAQGQLQYVGTPTTCVACHQASYNAAPSHVASQYPTTCEGCHTTVTWNAAGVGAAHPTVPIALTGVHSGAVISCVQCHTTTPYSSVQRTCDGCHHQDYLATSNPSHTSAGYGTDCATCHQLVAGWAGASINHPTTPIALTGVHSNNLISCEQCHTTSPFSSVPTTCDACHHTAYVAAKDPDHVAANFSVTCTECHGFTAGWLGATFNHPTAPVPVTGAHSPNLVTCNQCHTTMPYSTVQRTCDGCHHQEYLATTNPNHAAAGYSTDCSTCHQVVANWAGASLNHPSSPLALTGVHSNTLVTCAQCHTTMPYSGVPTTCDGCHHTDFTASRDPNHVDANFSTNCTTCHTLAANWVGARFTAHDGSVSQFRIYSGKHLGKWSQCSECHTLGQPYAATPSLLCLNCHAKVQTDTHRGRNYTVSDCVRSGCHADGSKP